MNERPAANMQQCMTHETGWKIMIKSIEIARDKTSRSVTPKKPSYSHLNGPASLFFMTSPGD